VMTGWFHSEEACRIFLYAASNEFDYYDPQDDNNSTRRMEISFQQGWILERRKVRRGKTKRGRKTVDRDRLRVYRLSYQVVLNLLKLVQHGDVIPRDAGVVAVREIKRKGLVYQFFIGTEKMGSPKEDFPRLMPVIPEDITEKLYVKRRRRK